MRAAARTAAPTARSPTRSTCGGDGDCEDGLFCDGAERCAPADPGADARGCAPAAPPCLAEQTCDEAARRCLTDCDVTGDADGDGHASVDCGGDDCDDADALRFAGNLEVCDAGGHDEDCDPSTLGGRDTALAGRRHPRRGLRRALPELTRPPSRRRNQTWSGRRPRGPPRGFEV